MMYKDKFIAVIKVNGKVLREVGDIVYIPFGSEYEIMMKNLSNRGVVIDIDIDGINVLDNDQLYIGASQTTTLEGFLDGKTSRVRNKFKFIEKTQEISEYRGDRIEDGIINIKYRFEKEKIYKEYHYIERWPYIPKIPYNIPSPPIVKYNNRSSDVYSSTVLNTQLGSSNDSGITVSGSKSNQIFNSVYCNDLESIEHNIVFVLKGQTQYNIVQNPVTVKTKVKCCTCGKVNKSNNKFCGNCGTALF